MQATQITPHFCEECKRIMIATNVGDELYYVCRNVNCNNKVRIDQTNEYCVYSKNYTVIQTTSHQSDVRYDPTYPRVRQHCDMCRCEQDHVYYYATHWAFNCKLQIFYICTNCGCETSKGGESIEGA